MTEKIEDLRARLGDLYYVHRRERGWWPWAAVSPTRLLPTPRTTEREALEAADAHRRAVVEASPEIAELRKRLEVAEQRNEMACIETDPKCECAGCLAARERNAPKDPQ